MRALRSLLGLLAAASLVACSSLNQGTLDGGARDAPSEAALDGGDVPDAPAAAIDVVEAPTIDAADVPTVDVPAPDIPAADVPAVDVPAADVPTVDVPTVDVPTVDVPTVDVPTVDVVDASDVRDAGRCAAGALLCSGICVPDPMSDPRHCGRCGNACVLQHVAVHACSAGLCRVGTCAAGFADCDAVPGNGCETAVDTEVSCGACGNACPARAHASPRCRAGACGVACDVGFGDCDADPSNGCEVTFDSDPAHCGVCSSTCGGGTGCGDGACVNIPTPRLIAPLSTSTVTTRSPTLRWRNLPGATGAVVHVATSPNFSGEVTVAVASGSSARVGPLAPGTWYWYAQGVSRVSTNTGFQNTPVWQFVVGQGSAA